MNTTLIQPKRAPRAPRVASPSARAAAFAIMIAIASMIPSAAQERGLSVIAKSIVGPEFDVGRQYAVIIGIDKYEQWPSLKSAAAEARDVRRVLAERYYVDEFFELYDRDATAAGIRRLFLDTLPKKVGLKDSLLIFYAGHGYLDESKTGFWIASDGDKDVYSQRGWIPNAQLRNYVAGLKVQRVLLVADACFSGDFLNVTRGAGPTVDSAYFKKALSLTARQVLTSGSSETVPDESEFGRQLVSILERNTEPVLDPHTMFDRIRRGVAKTEPLIGTIPGNETGATFALFLKPRSGSLAISVASAADIYVDGVKAGRASPGAPFPISELAPGQRKVEARYASFAEERLVVVEAGLASLAAFSYKPATTGSLSLSGFPEGAVLFLDGGKAGEFGQSALSIDGLAAGKVRARVEYGLWPAPAEYEASIEAGKAASIKFMGGSIIASGLPRGVSVYSKEAFLGSAAKADDSVTVGPLPTGSYALRFEGAGWERAELTVFVPAGRDVVCVPTMRPAKAVETAAPAAGAAGPGAASAAAQASGTRAGQLVQGPAAAPAVGKAQGTAVPAGVGVLSLVSDPPGLSIKIDDDQYALTPESLELKPGSHRIKLERSYVDDKFFVASEAEWVTVPDGGTVEIAVKPERGAGMVDFGMVPPGYKVISDNGTVGVTPLGKLGFKAGAVKLSFEKADEPTRRYVGVLYPDSEEKVPWGGTQDLALKMERRTIDLRKLESWNGIPPLFAPAIPQKAYTGVLSAAGTGITALYMCRDEKYLYWRVDFESTNPVYKLPKGTKKAITLELGISDGRGGSLRPELSYSTDNKIWNLLGMDKGGKWSNLAEEVLTYHRTATSAVMRISIDKVSKYIPKGIQMTTLYLAHNTGSGWESGWVRLPMWYVDYDW